MVTWGKYGQGMGAGLAATAMVSVVLSRAVGSRGVKRGHQMGPHGSCRWEGGLPVIQGLGPSEFQHSVLLFTRVPSAPKASMFQFPRTAFPVWPYLPLLPQFPPPSCALAQLVSPLVVNSHGPLQHPCLCSYLLLSCHVFPPPCLPKSSPPPQGSHPCLP